MKPKKKLTKDYPGAAWKERTASARDRMVCVDMPPDYTKEAMRAGELPDLDGPQFYGLFDDMRGHVQSAVASMSGAVITDKTMRRQLADFAQATRAVVKAYDGLSQKTILRLAKEMPRGHPLHIVLVDRMRDLRRAAEQLHYATAHVVNKSAKPDGRPPFGRIRRQLIRKLGRTFDLYYSAQWASEEEYLEDLHASSLERDGERYKLAVEAGRFRVNFVRHVLLYHENNEPRRFSNGLELPPNTYRRDRDLIKILGSTWQFPKNRILPSPKDVSSREGSQEL